MMQHIHNNIVGRYGKSGRGFLVVGKSGSLNYFANRYMYRLHDQSPLAVGTCGVRGRVSEQIVRHMWTWGRGSILRVQGAGEWFISLKLLSATCLITLSAGVVLALLFFFFRGALSVYLGDIETLRTVFAQMDGTLSVATVSILGTLAVIFAVPLDELVVVARTALLPFGMASLVAGTLIAQMIFYFLGRAAALRFSEWNNQNIERVEIRDRLIRFGFPVVLALYTAPLMPFIVSSFLLGLIGIGKRVYIGATIIGATVSVFLIYQFGSTFAVFNVWTILRALGLVSVWYFSHQVLVSFQPKLVPHMLRHLPLYMTRLRHQ